MTEKAFGGSTSALVDDRGDGTHVPVVKILGSTTGGGSSTSSAGGGIIGVDTAGTKWLLIADTSTTPAAISYYKVADGTTGTPVGGFTPDADQNSLTDAQLRASAIAVSAQALPLPSGAATEASLGTDGTAPPSIAGTGIRGWLRGIYEKLAGTLTVVQSGTWTVQPGNTANTTAWLVTNPSLASVTAGTAPTKAAVTGAVYNATTPSLTDTQSVALQADAAGNLLTTVKTALPAGTNRVGTVGLHDGTTAVAVKAASTAAAAADPALVVAVSPNNTVPVITPLPTNPIAGQVKIATTGTAVTLPSNTLKNGVVIKAKSSNAQPLFVGASGVTTTDDGTGTGYKLEAGEAVSFAVANSNTIYINGTAGDSVYFSGN